MSDAYKQAGVDIHAGYEAVERMKRHIARTERSGVFGAIGGFGGCFDLSALSTYEQPMLISGTDGVGTKLLLAIQQQSYNTVGIDCVAMCVNDIVAQGAEPLYFLDYIAVGKNNPAMIESIVSGVAEGCVQAGAALIGGETAEMPDMYEATDFDLAGFAVGIVEKSRLIKPELVEEGDILIGLASSGLHSNGYSLVRKIFFKDHSYGFDAQFPELSRPLGEELLTPTRIYVKEILALHQLGLLHGVAHITGGGFVENIPRMLPSHLQAKIQLGSWNVLPIFHVLQRLGNVTDQAMYETFNMGIGMVIAVSATDKEHALDVLRQYGTEAYVIGSVVSTQDDTIVGKEVLI
ncbi:phosphoribosylformylglycinamidine cyclo-ligase [Aerococcaceae bacterium NML190073]|nr:phosphoribosylformylglycinamidine cyclo-ligase [Aerococcaceae bacterium NML190073]